MINESATLLQPVIPSTISYRGWKIALGILALAVPLALAEVNMIGPHSIFGPSDGGIAGVASRLGSDGRAGFNKAGATLLDVLGLRSPGERSQGDLADTKGRRITRRSAFVPHQRALAKVRQPKRLVHQRVPTPPPSDSIRKLLDTIAPLPVGGSDLTGAIVPNTGPIFGGVPIGGAPGGLIFGGGGGGGGGGGIPPITQSPPPITSAVPEPSTWALMLLGFGAIGLSLRRARRRASGPAVLSA